MSQHSHAPRECRVVKSVHYAGYGFNLYQEKNKPGQFIGRIEPGSPADLAGLKENDRLVEVNRVNIAGENHKQVVARIKSREGETVLLVADSEADQYHKERGVIIKSSLPYLVKRSNVEEEDLSDEENIDTRLQTVTFKEESSEESEPSGCSTKDRREQSVSRQDSGVSTDSPQPPLPPPDPLGRGLSVQEMKERLRRRRRPDPRLSPGKRQSGDWWSQYKMIQTL